MWTSSSISLLLILWASIIYAAIGDAADEAATAEKVEEVEEEEEVVDIFAGEEAVKLTDSNYVSLSSFFFVPSHFANIWCKRVFPIGGSDPFRDINDGRLVRQVLRSMVRTLSKTSSSLGGTCDCIKRQAQCR